MARKSNLLGNIIYSVINHVICLTWPNVYYNPAYVHIGGDRHSFTRGVRK
jgi:hypothetical protein